MSVEACATLGDGLGSWKWGGETELLRGGEVGVEVIKPVSLPVSIMTFNIQ